MYAGLVPSFGLKMDKGFIRRTALYLVQRFAYSCHEIKISTFSLLLAGNMAIIQTNGFWFLKSLARKWKQLIR